MAIALTYRQYVFDEFRRSAQALGLFMPKKAYGADWNALNVRKPRVTTLGLRNYRNPLAGANPLERNSKEFKGIQANPLERNPSELWNELYQQLQTVTIPNFHNLRSLAARNITGTD